MSISRSTPSMVVSVCARSVGAPPAAASNACSVTRPAAPAPPAAPAAPAPAPPAPPPAPSPPSPAPAAAASDIGVVAEWRSCAVDELRLDGSPRTEHAVVVDGGAGGIEAGGAPGP
eukprot:scaffold7933_cov51-Phaeocystis_antarctica.AAC.3